jgi:hypothetical protein
MDYCRHPLLQRPPRINLITGESEVISIGCGAERLRGTQCGPNGNLWEPKDALPVGLV